jgi:thioester reductase-like protein
MGTQELLRLAAASGGSRLHALSTLSIFGPGYPAGRTPGEQELPAVEDLAGDGYGRSKYVAERLLETGRRYGISSVVYRLGEVWPHRRLGVANPASFAHSVLYACVRTGCVFETAATTTVTPVDVVAELVTGAATGGLSVPDGTAHLLWPTTLRLRDVFATLTRGAAVGPGQLCGVPPSGRCVDATT